jgi:hypothetical protein
MDFEDRLYLDMRRGRVPALGLDLIRMDRAILYAKKQIQRHIEFISEKKTKSIGDYVYRLHRFQSELYSIFAKGRDSALLEKISSTIRGIHHRTLREDVIRKLKETYSLLNSYEAIESVEDVEVLREQVEDLQTRIASEEGQQTTAADVDDQKVCICHHAIQCDLQRRVEGCD